MCHVVSESRQDCQSALFLSPWLVFGFARSALPRALKAEDKARETRQVVSLDAERAHRG